MELIGLQVFLRRHNRIALDTSVFIYELERNSKYIELTHLVFSWLEKPRHLAVTSTITMTELLVRPYRDHDIQQARNFFGMLSTYPHLEWIAPDLSVARTAARLRAAHRLQTPDAIQAATAIQYGATGVITNDSVFERVEDFETLVLEKFLV